MNWPNSTKRIVCSAWLLLLLRGTAPGVVALTDTSRPSAHGALEPVGLDEVQWTDGFWADRFKTVHDRSLPAMWEIMKGNKYKPFLQNFQIAAGEMQGEHHGAPFNDGDFYKFLEAVTAVYGATHDPELKAILDTSIKTIGKAQRADGYIHTPVLIAQRNGDKNIQPFQKRTEFEAYNMGHLITAACLHYRATGSEEFLNIARNAGEFLLGATFSKQTQTDVLASVCPSHYMALVELGRTKTHRYLCVLDLAIDKRHELTDSGDDNQNRISFVDQREATGHAVRANYLYAGIADQFIETGDEYLKEPLEAIWKDVTEHKMYITGGCGALYDGASPDGSSDQKHITRVHQAYGRNYQLPNITAHNETCAAVGNVLWNWRMFVATGEAKYIDVLELSLYNAVLSGISLDGTNYFYTNPLRQVEPLPTKLRWSRTRQPFISTYCCPPNVLRTIAEASGYAYSKTKDALWVNLYGSNKLSTSLYDQPLKLMQQTKYPWDGRVTIAIDACPADEFALKLRIPGWADSATIRVNGSTADVKATPGSYAEIRRRWKAGDRAELELPMPTRLMEANPLVEEARNQVAIKRGPIVYCLESTDLPKGVRVQDVVIPANAKLSKQYDAKLLNGVVVLSANARAKPRSDWEGKLYQPLPAAPQRELEVRFIPYYAWSNRGPSEMSVWLPVQ